MGKRSCCSWASWEYRKEEVQAERDERDDDDEAIRQIFRPLSGPNLQQVWYGETSTSPAPSPFQMMVKQITNNYLYTNISGANDRTV